MFDGKPLRPGGLHFLVQPTCAPSGHLRVHLCSAPTPAPSGVTKLVVAINKMDDHSVVDASGKWSKER